MGKNNISKWIRMMRKSNPKTSVVPSFDEADSGKVLAAGKEGEPTWANCESGGTVRLYKGTSTDSEYVSLDNDRIAFLGCWGLTVGTEYFLQGG